MEPDKYYVTKMLFRLFLVGLDECSKGETLQMSGVGGVKFSFI